MTRPSVGLKESRKKLYAGQPAVTDTLLYTAPAGNPTVVTNIHVANTTAIDATITIGLNSGGALAIANHFLSAITVPARGVLDWEGEAAVDASGTIRALQGTAAALTVQITGYEQI